MYTINTRSQEYITSMACSQSSLCCFNHEVPSRRKINFSITMRSQSFRNNGKPENSVDAKLSVLRERIEGVRKKERLNNKNNTCGWNYEHNYDPKHKRSSHAVAMIIISQFGQVMSISCGVIGLVSLFGTICIFLISFLVHM